MDIQEEAKKYAEGRIISAFNQAIEEAYIKGYNAACDEMQNNQQRIVEVDGMQFLDMELPSGTLWSAGYLTEQNSIKTVTFNQAQKYSLPTKEQWEELNRYCIINSCYITYQGLGIEIISIDRNIIRIPTFGYREGDSYKNFVRFWLKEENEYAKTLGFIVQSTHIKDSGIQRVHVGISSYFKGEQLPILLVKTRE